MTNNSIEDLKRELAESQARSHGLARRVVEAETKLEIAEAEVERLKKELDAWDYGTRAKREQARAEKAEAEIEHIKALLKDPSAVHINTLRGTIAGLSWDGYEHILGPHPCRERAEKAEAEVAKINHQLLNTESDLIQSQAEVERLRDELELYKAANSDVRRIAEERNKAISLAKAALKLLSISEGQWDYNEDTLELTRIESELEVLNSTNK